MTKEEAQEAFGPKASDFKGALFEGDRFLVYTDLERKTCKGVGGAKLAYTIYRRGQVIVGVYLDSAVIAEDIPGEDLFGTDEEVATA
jgi:hypothetical protein